jgi:hypothetical protein
MDTAWFPAPEVCFSGFLASEFLLFGGSSPGTWLSAQLSVNPRHTNIYFR